MPAQAENKAALRGIASLMWSNLNQFAEKGINLCEEGKIFRGLR